MTATTTTQQRPLRVLITGAAQGLGASLAAAWEQRGAEVLRTDRPAVAVEREDVLGLDITSDADWAAARDHVERTWGGLDVLVNNAGIAGGGRLDVSTMDEWQRLVDINLMGAVRGTATFTPVFKRQRGGTIVNVASLAGLVHPAGMAGYNATKAAVVALTETTGHELAAYGVSAHVVCPSYFRTGLLAGAQGADTALTGVMSQLVDHARLGPDDIATAVLDALDAGTEVILPDPDAARAFALKQADRAAYDQTMRAQARKLAAAAGETVGEPA
ncbi:SDR family NAD(P)-dependent oxidoreductase [Nocardioides sp. GY 10113]|uniref:SDR family NAD(P)-dependent oxidoreductase n=1 Tax=Nocardioides sp. GY 10113 TaxID=2569761 RepID=UPI0019807A78|nr:SDR family NAD(P)-dependent oxidoreductase [Nocardioides sp. GY 10113]